MQSIFEMSLSIFEIISSMIIFNFGLFWVSWISFCLDKEARYCCVVKFLLMV